MTAVTLDSLATPPALREDLPAPTPAGDEVLVRVQASSANPVDNSIAAGMLKDMVEHEFPVTLGRDYAGVVEQVGAEVTRYAVGDEVFGFLMHANPTVHDGSWAELITVFEEVSIAPRPADVDVVTAGAAPLAAIAAMTAIDALELSEGDTVLIVGATGGVLAASPSSSPPRRAPRSSLPRWPRRSSTCASSASPRLCRARETSPPQPASASPKVSTRCWTSSTTRRAPTRPRSRTARVSPRRPAPPAKAPAARWSWRSRRPPTSNASRSCSKLAPLGCPFRRPTSSVGLRRRSRRSARPTPRASSPSAFSDTRERWSGRTPPDPPRLVRRGRHELDSRRPPPPAPSRRSSPPVLVPAADPFGPAVFGATLTAANGTRRVPRKER